MLQDSRPLITILMPCYNAMPFLPAALDSILNQTYTNLEILCINDGSTDSTPTVLEDYAKKDPRIKVIHNEENLNLIRSLNKGISLATGVFIARMDADDISVLNRIEVEYNFMKNNPDVDVASCGMRVMTESGKIVSKESPRQNTTMGCLFASFFYVPFHHAPMIVKTEVLKKYPFINEEHVLHAEDFELFSRLLRNKVSIRNMDELLYDVRLNSQSVSRKYTDIQDKNFVECARQHYNLYTGKEYESQDIRIMVNRFDRQVALKDFKFAMKEMKSFKQYFINRERVKDREVIREINLILKTQLLDICLQTIKKCSPGMKIFAMFKLWLHSYMFLDVRMLAYIKDKIK